MKKGINPILKGFHPDPCILRVKDDYYIATSTFQWFGGVQLYHSKDLINWEELPSPLSRVSQLDLKGVPNSGGVWAPCLSYHNGVFYLIYTVVKNFHGIFKDTHNYLVTTTDIKGDWSEPIYLNSSGFDPSLFHDGDKKYLLNMQWDHRTENHAFAGILLQEYSEKEKKLIGKPVNIFKGTEIGATEAPHLYKINGYYYLMVAEGGTLYHHGIRMARSKNILGPYEIDPKPLLTTRDNPDYYLQRTGHGSLIDTLSGKYYVAYLCGRPIGEKRRCLLGRETCISEVVFDEDGWLRLKNGGTLPLIEYYSDEIEFKYKKKEEKVLFNEEELPIAFKTLRIPFEMIGSLKERKGYLRLYGNEAITSLNHQSLVARRLDSFVSSSTIKMEFNPFTFQQMAGLTVFYDTFNFYYLYLSHYDENNNELRVLSRNNLVFSDHIVNKILIPKNQSIWLKCEINHLSLDFLYSLDGKNFIKIVSNLDCSNLSDEAYSLIGHEGHTGTFVGVACQDLSGNHLYADFEYFEYIGEE